MRPYLFFDISSCLFFDFISLPLSFPPLLLYALSLLSFPGPALLHPMGFRLNLSDKIWLICPSYTQNRIIHTKDICTAVYCTNAIRSENWTIRPEGENRRFMDWYWNGNEKQAPWPVSFPWWRWRESNSRPKAFPQEFLRAQLMVWNSDFWPSVSKLTEILSR